MALAIKVENLGKAYQLGEIGTGTISRDLERYWAKLRGKEDPFLRIGENNDRTKKGNSDIVWSLKDLNFEIEQGDAVGIIGSNGAGKSTLLKILSRVTSPTTGNIKIKGRVANLLEVGTGFHPELTGRENIFLNGAILGMRKQEIAGKFDEIVDFSGVERYIDTPVKRYSSGMYVRLAFAVAAHLESEVLVVDEVLAVGDAEFQKKCLGKMNDVSKGEGRTVLFVSHNMQSIQNLCINSLLLKNGTLKQIGKTSQIINKYLNEKRNQNSFSNAFSDTKIAQLITATNIFQDSKKISLSLEVYATEIIKCSIDFILSDFNLNPIGFGSCGSLDYDKLVNLKIGSNNLNFEINIEDLAIGTYFLSIDITKPNVIYYDRVYNCINFKILKDKTNTSRRYVMQEWNHGSLILKTTLIK